MPATRALLGACVWLVFACASPPAAPPPPAPVATPLAAARAWEHLEALVDIGPRVPGTEGASRALEYARAELEALGIEVEEQGLLVEDRGDGQPIEVRNLVGTIPGASPDLFVLAAALDTRSFDTFEHVGAAAASGPALLLALASDLVREPLPYTVRLAFLGAEAAQDELRPSQGLWSSRLLVEELSAQGLLDRIRLVVYFGQVADAELTIARDLLSHRTYRDAFFKAARRLGHDDVFPSSAGFDSVFGGEVAFVQARMRRVVAITDPRYGGDQPPGIYHHTEQDTLERLSADNLIAVGEVSEQALRDIGALLQRVDRFARRRSVDDSAAEGPVEVPSLLEPDQLAAPEEVAAGSGEPSQPREAAAPEAPEGEVESDAPSADESMGETPSEAPAP